MRVNYAPGSVSSYRAAVELLHLRYFVAVAEELSFAGAARRLNMAASPLSRRIMDLEIELGKRLFDRSTHHVRLTQAGAALLPLARDVLDRVGAIPWRLEETMEARRGMIVFGMLAAVHPDLRQRVDALAERLRPRYELKRWPGTTADLVAAVREGEIAFTLARLPIAEPALDRLPVMSEQLGAVVPADRFAGRESVSLAELADVPFISPPKGISPLYFQQLDRQLHEMGVRKRVSSVNAGFEGMPEIVSSGQGFSITMLDDRSPMHRYLLDNAIVLPFTDFSPRLDTVLLWRRDRAERGDLSKVVDTVREIFSEPLVK